MIQEYLDGGGMGGVYRAFDQRLQIPVAIKVMLPQQGATASEWTQFRAQFRQEAMILARLNHPNIANVSDYFEIGNTGYLVMEYVQGKTMQSLLEEEGRIDEDQLLTWALPLLDALHYCHTQRVIHRDLKPGNIMIRSDNTPILIDFGLVKQIVNTTRPTEKIIKGMGTPEYTPPEQYDGSAGRTDNRSDIYSFGATLYHALTGVAPASATQRSSDPTVLQDIQAIVPNISERTANAITTAIALRQDERHATAKVMADALTPLQSTPTSNSTVFVAVGLFTIALVAGILGYILLNRDDEVVETVYVTAIVTETEQSFTPTKISTQTPSPLPPTLTPTNTEVPPTPTYTELPSPTPIPTAVPSITTDLSTNLGGGSGRIIFLSDSEQDQYVSAIYSMNIDGSDVRRITGLGTDYEEISVSPDGRQIVASDYLDGAGDIYLLDSDGSNLRKLISNSAHEANPVWSPTGQSIAFVSDRAGTYSLYSMNADGSDVTRLTSYEAWGSDFSRDGNAILFHGYPSGGDNAEIFLIDVDGSDTRQLTNNSRKDWLPTFSPDNRQIVFYSFHDATNDSAEIYIMDADGSNVQRLTDNVYMDWRPSFSPDGQWILFNTKRYDNNTEIAIMRPDGSDVQRLTYSKANETFPLWEPSNEVIITSSSIEIPPLPTPSRSNTPTATALSTSTKIRPSFRPPSPEEQNALPTVWDYVNFRDIQSPDTENYDLIVYADESIRLSWAWCANNRDELYTILQPLTVQFFMDNSSINSSKFTVYEAQVDSSQCQIWNTVIDNWNGLRATQAEIRYQLETNISESGNIYHKGTYQHILNISIRY